MTRTRRAVLIVGAAVWAAGINLASADYPHSRFNTNAVAEVRLYGPEFVADMTGISQADFSSGRWSLMEEAVPLNRSITNAADVAGFHSMAKSEHCMVPHVTGSGPGLCILGYFDAKSNPLALIKLWPDGVYYIYEGYVDTRGKVFKGKAKGDHGGCSCGKSAELAKAVSAILYPAAPDAGGTR